MTLEIGNASLSGSAGRRLGTPFFGITRVAARAARIDNPRPPVWPDPAAQDRQVHVHRLTDFSTVDSPLDRSSVVVKAVGMGAHQDEVLLAKRVDERVVCILRPAHFPLHLTRHYPPTMTRCKLISLRRSVNYV